ncbi:LytTR family DNA-binding domain-containing protein [Gemmobacter denitrificans]|uniref:LytTR family DNA-binding domain-containing protein n=1 Tax=Gemmobacter denitrificans TaxID=3123040 RepID=A0ABU8BUH6_9RHOB
MAVGMMVGMTIRAFVRGVLRQTDFLRGAVLVAVLSALVMSGPLYLLSARVFDAVEAMRPSLIDLVIFVFGISLLIGAVREMLTTGAVPVLLSTADLPDQPEDQPLPRVVARLEPELQGRLLALTVRDHYVDVYTSKGRGALLIRLADAIAEAEGEAGTQIHRSHWVAWAAIRAVEKENGRVWVRLCPELRMPVSKSHRAKLEDRGLL